MHQRIILYIIVWIIGVIVLPIILQSGYIFAIDQALHTGWWIPKLWANNYWIGWVSQLFVFLGIPIWGLEKLLVVTTFTLPVVGIYLYCKKFISPASNWALFFALSLSICNPMLYSRFLDGQVNIYVFYSLFPLFLYFTKYFFEYKTLISAIQLGLWWLLLVTTTLHATYFIFFVFLAFSVSQFSQIWKKEHIFKYTTGILIIIFLQLLYLVPFFLDAQQKETSLISQIERFDTNQQLAFSNIPPEKNPYREILSLRGYWGDYENRFIESHDIFGDNSKNDWIYFIWFLIVLGIVLSFKHKNPDRYTFLILGILGFVLSLWTTNNTIFSGFNTLLYEYLPLYSGFREPQKFVLFLVVAYIYFGYFGIVAIQKFFTTYTIQKHVSLAVLVFCVLSPVIYNFNMLFGFRGQVSIQNYPPEWQETQQYLAENSCTDCQYSTLVFPWHGYMSISWTRKVVGTWIVRYFWPNVLYGDTIEIGNVYTTSLRPESNIIENYIAPKGILRETQNLSKEDLLDFSKEIETLWIKNIILLKEADYQWYQDILESMVENSIIEKVQENDLVTLYQIK